MRILKWLIPLVLLSGALAPVASAEVQCGHYNSNYTAFIFDGLPGTHDYNFGPTAVGNGMNYSFSHKFDVTPDGQNDVWWELTYCIHIYRASDGAESVYGKTKYFKTDGSAFFGDDQGDDNPQYVKDWGNFPNASDLNFYTVNNANGSNDDFLILGFWFLGNQPDSTVTVQANWRAHYGTCQ